MHVLVLKYKISRWMFSINVINLIEFMKINYIKVDRAVHKY